MPIRNAATSRDTQPLRPAPPPQVSDLEVDTEEQEGQLYYFKYRLADGDGPDDYLAVATTRPETILGDAAVCVHPDDERYKHLVGKEALMPMTNKRVPIIADDYVQMDFGSGALKITPAHDNNDYEIGKRWDLPMINIMNLDATLNEVAGKYAGLDRYECRKQLWADMEAEGLTLKIEKHMQRVPISQRGGEVIEPMLSSQWFVKMDGMAAKGCDAVRNGEIQIIPERFEKVYFNWLENIQDWCVSRQLWWGHRIPVWYADEHKDDLGQPRYFVARSEADAHAQAEAALGAGVALRQDDDVLDTWFSSGLWPFATVGWPAKDEASLKEFNRFYPSAVMETGYDILFFWVARMVMLGIEFTGKAPFHTIYMHGLVRDGQGAKMSKTKGNVVDPLDTIGECVLSTRSMPTWPQRRIARLPPCPHPLPSPVALTRCPHPLPSPVALTRCPHPLPCSRQLRHGRTAPLSRHWVHAGPGCAAGDGEGPGQPQFCQQAVEHRPVRCDGDGVPDCRGEAGSRGDRPNECGRSRQAPIA